MAMLLVLFTCLAFFLSLTIHVSADNYNLYITNVSYSVNSKYLTLAHSLIDGRRLNVTSELSGTVTKALLHGELFVMPADGSSNKYYSFMKKSLETCKFLANPESEPILNAIWQEVAKDSRHNIALKCPVQPGTYYLRNFELDTKKIPPMLPSVKFYTKITAEITVNDEVESFDSRVYGILENLSTRK